MHVCEIWIEGRHGLSEMGNYRTISACLEILLKHAIKLCC